MEEKVIKFAEKEAKMRESITVLEDESRKIYEIVVEKEQIEESQSQELESLRQEVEQKNI